MNWKNRLTNYNFWISIVSAVLLILQAFKFEFDIAYINEIVTAVLGLLVVIGIISDPTRTTMKQSSAETKENTEKKEKSDAIPSDNKNEIDYEHIQSDFKTIVDKISQDISSQIENLKISQNNQQVEVPHVGEVEILPSDENQTTIGEIKLKEETKFNDDENSAEYIESNDNSSKENNMENTTENVIEKTEENPTNEIAFQAEQTAENLVENLTTYNIVN